MKHKTLTTKNLQVLFGVTAMTIYNWKSKRDLPADPTPAAARRWSHEWNIAMTCDPKTLLGAGVAKPGPKPRGQGPKKLLNSTPKRVGRKTAAQVLLGD